MLEQRRGAFGGAMMRCLPKGHLLAPWAAALCVLIPWAGAGAASHNGLVIYVDIDSFETTGICRWTIHLTAAPRDGAPVVLRPQADLRGVACAMVTPSEASASPETPAHFLIETGGWTPGGAFPSATIGFRDEPGARWQSPLPFVIDLTTDEWTATATGSGVTTPGPGERLPRQVRLPRAMVVRGEFDLTRGFDVPQAWRGLPAWFISAPIDDEDVTSVNGREVGRDAGWDRPRAYPIPENALKFGGTNELRIRVRNVYPPVAGIYGRPIEIRFGDRGSSASLLADTGLQDEAARRPPGRIGAPKPRRALRVADGVLRFADGDEAALWGVNYIPSIWVSRKGEPLRDDQAAWRASIDEDFTGLKRWGVDIIRIPVFDGNFIGADGAIAENEFTDSLDYLVRKCDEAGFYLHLTPITSIAADGTESHTLVRSKGSSVLNATEWPAQKRALREMLTRPNRHTGRRLADEPCLAIVELVNEPHGYWTLDEVTNRFNDSARFSVPADVSARGMDALARDWEAFAPEGKRTGAAYAHFAYGRVLGYINTMIRVVRDCGVDAPVFFHADGPPEIRKAIADSQIDGVSIWAYPGDLTTVTDSLNLLGQTGNAPLDAVYANKARIAYEFDAAGQVRGCAMFPAIARHLRSRGAQAACQFQYDPLALAAINAAWPQHYLNALHTPEKWVGFLAGGELFRGLPRGVDAGRCADDCVFDGVAVSFHRNGVRLSRDGVFMSAGAPGWQPLPPPKVIGRAVVSGAGPVLATEGRRIGSMTVSGKSARLEVSPAVTMMDGGWRGTVDKPLTRLDDKPATVTITLPGRRVGQVWRMDGGKRSPVRTHGNDLTAKAGEYQIDLEAIGK